MEIDDNQIVDMPITEFKCKLKLECNENTNIVLQGNVKDFGTFPLTLYFNVDKFKSFSNCFNKTIFNKSLKHVLDCKVTQKVKLAKTNVLTIDADQQTKIHLTNEIFGPATAKYVTRNQLDTITSQLMSDLNVYEEFEFDDEKDNNYIRNEILKQTASETFKSVPIKEALDSLSSFNINKDLAPDVIISDLSKILRIEKKGDKEHIKLNKEEYDKYLTRSKSEKEGGGGLNFGLFKIGGSGKGFNEQESQKESSYKSVNDQLHEFNSDETNDVTFEQRGEMIVPKSLKVAKLSKVEFSKKLTFKQIKQKLEVTKFEQECPLISFVDASTFVTGKFL